MSFVITREPAIEPLRLAEVKQHLRIDLADEDELLHRLIKSARQHIEHSMGLALIDQERALFVDCWPLSGIIKIPHRPVISVIDIIVHGSNGEETSILADDYFVDIAAFTSRILLRRPQSAVAPLRAAKPIEVRLQMGFGQAGDNVPAPIRQAMLLLIAHWHANREAISGDTGQSELPLGVASLLRPWQRVQL